MENIGVNKASDSLSKWQDVLLVIAALVVALVLLNYFISSDKGTQTNVSEKDANLVDMASVTSLK